MKKTLLALSVVGSLLLTACSNDEMMTSGNGLPDGTVIFTLTPQSSMSRSFSNGETATALHYAVYEAGTSKVVFTSKNGNDPVFSMGSSLNFTLALKLVKGKNYDFVFWADCGEGSPYTFDADNQTVTVNYDAPIANDDKRDAFFQVVKNLEITGSMEQTVILRRPFAQVNIGTSDLSFANTTLSTTVASTSFYVEGVHDALNLYTGVASGDKKVTFTADGVPEGETFPYRSAGTTYDYLAMNYLLTGVEPDEDDVQHAKSELMNATFTITYTNGKSQDINIPNMPVQRNYRTNIFGQLITSPIDFTIKVDPAYYDPDYNYSELQLAALSGGTVTLSSDVNLWKTEDTSDGPLNYLIVAAGKSLILDLNGKTITGGLKVYGDLIIKDSGNGLGKVQPAAGSATHCIYAAEGSKVTIEGGTYIAGTNKNGISNSTIYSDGGDVTISGGEFSAQQEYNGKWYVLNKKEGSTGNITVKGGTFENQNPANGDVNNDGSLVPKGYTSVLVEGTTNKWTVVEGVNTLEAAKECIVDPEFATIKVIEDLDLSSLTQEELTFSTPKTFNIVEGKTVTLPVGSALRSTQNLTIKGGTIKKAEGSTTGSVDRNDPDPLLNNSDTRCLIVIRDADLTLDGVTLINDMDFHSHGGAANNAAITYIGNSNLTFTNSTVKSGGFAVCSWRSPSGTGTLYFNGCTFESNSSRADGTYSEATLRLNGTSGVMENCTVKGYNYALWVENKLEMTINSGTYTTPLSNDNRDASIPVYVTDGSKVIIKGGSFSGAKESYTSAEGNNSLVIGKGGGVFDISGGKFSGKACGTGGVVCDPAEGYKYQAIEGDDTYKWEVVENK